MRLARGSGAGADADSVILSRSADPSRRRVRGRRCDRHAGAPDLERPERGARPDRRRGKSAGSEWVPGLEPRRELGPGRLHAAARRKRARHQPGPAQEGDFELRSADAVRRNRGDRDLSLCPGRRDQRAGEYGGGAGGALAHGVAEDELRIRRCRQRLAFELRGVQGRRGDGGHPYPLQGRRPGDRRRDRRACPDGHDLGAGCQGAWWTAAGSRPSP